MGTAILSDETINRIFYCMIRVFFDDFSAFPSSDCRNSQLDENFGWVSLKSGMELFKKSCMLSFVISEIHFVIERYIMQKRRLWDEGNWNCQWVCEQLIGNGSMWFRNELEVHTKGCYVLLFFSVLPFKSPLLITDKLTCNLYQHFWSSHVLI